MEKICIQNQAELYIGDCRDVMRTFAEESIDLVLTSPPYDELRSYEKTLNWNFEIFKEVANEIFRILKKGGVCVWVVGDATINGSETGSSFRQALYFKEIGLNLHDTMPYEKINPTPNTGNGKRYQQAFEYMFVLSKGMPKTVNLILEKRRNTCNDKRKFRIMKRQRNKDGHFEEKHPYYIKEFVPRSNVWKYKVGLHNTTSDKLAFEHPAIFPEQLAEDHILSWTNEGDIVFDPFCGSGTAGKMSVRNKRKFKGSDIVKKYISDIAKKRIESELTQGKFEL